MLFLQFYENEDIDTVISQSAAENENEPRANYRGLHFYENIHKLYI